MRILFISAFYPPHVIGGWEQLVENINTRLQARGHITHVLTSTYGASEEPSDEPGVDRCLSLENDLDHYDPLRFLIGRRRRLNRNLRYVRAAIEDFTPDVVFVHVMWALSKSVPWMAEQLLPGRVVYYIANDWPYVPDVNVAYWRDPARNAILRLPKRLLAWPSLKVMEREERDFSLRFTHVLCVSHAVKADLVRRAGIPLDRMRVIYNGIEVDQFSLASQSVGGRSNQQGLSLLYAGTLAHHKGVHTAIEAMNVLAHQSGMNDVSLTIVGSGHPDYEAYLRALADRYGLSESVHFQPRVPREEMPGLLHKFDALIFPSIWQEPLARMVQEAMAMGLVVVGTTTGGTKEILIEGETGLTFAPEDSGALARQIERLRCNPQLRMRLARNAHDVVLRKFDIRRMIDEIEAYLSQMASDGGAMSELQTTLGIPV